MLLMIVLFGILLYRIYKVKEARKITIIFLIVCIPLIIIHTLLLYSAHGDYFAGSDASGFYYYYGKPLAYMDRNNSLISEMSGMIRYKYWGFLVYNMLSQIPKVSDLTASIIIRMNNLILMLITVSKVLEFYIKREIDIKSNKNKLFIVSAVFILLWGVFFNFRDIIISCLLILLFFEFFSFEKAKRKIINCSIYILLLVFFRDEFVFLTIVSSLLSWGLLRIRWIKRKALVGSIVIVMIFLIYSYIPLIQMQESMYKYYGVFVFLSRRMSGLEFFLNYIYEVILAFVGFNPLKYVPYLITDNMSDRTWILTGITGTLTIIFSIIGYYLVMPLYFALLSTRKLKDYLKNSKLQKLIIVSSIFFFLVISTYAGRQGQVQERIRLTIYPLILLSAVPIKFNYRLNRMLKDWSMIFLAISIIYILIDILIVR